MFESTTHNRDELEKLNDRVADAMELCDDLSCKADLNEDHLLSAELIVASMVLDKVYAEINTILYGK